MMNATFCVESDIIPRSLPGVNNTLNYNNHITPISGYRTMFLFIVFDVDKLESIQTPATDISILGGKRIIDNRVDVLSGGQFRK